MKSPYAKERIAELRRKHGTRRKKMKLKPKPRIKGAWKQ